MVVGSGCSKNGSKQKQESSGVSNRATSTASGFPLFPAAMRENSTLVPVSIHFRSFPAVTLEWCRKMSFFIAVEDRNP